MGEDVIQVDRNGKPTGSGQIRVAHVATVDITHRFLLLGQLLRLRDEGFEVTAISAPGPYVEELEGHGIRHVPWRHATRAWHPWSDTRALLELIGILRRGAYHVVHTHNPKPGIMGRLAAREARVPVIVNTVHGFYATPDDSAARRLPVLALERLAATCSDMELYQSREDLGWARRAHVVETARSRYLGNGTDLARFDPGAISSKRLADLRHELGISPDALVVGTMGRMVVEKGYREFFAAAREVRREFGNVRFVAVGEIDAVKADAMEPHEIAEASTEVIFPRWRHDVPNLLALMDVFVLASWREGMPRSAIEAAAMGCALVLTDIRGCREVVRHGIEGLLVPPRDARELSVAISRLLSDPRLRTRLGAAARRRALERFDEGRVGDAIVACYRELLASKGIVGTPVDHAGLANVRIRAGRRDDVAAIARLHTDVLPTAFLPLLGQRFLRRLFGAMVDDRDAVVVVAERGREVIGYAAGVLSMPAFRRRLLARHGVSVGLVVAPKLLRPGVLHRVLETTRYPEKTRGLPEAEWTFVGVKRGTAPGLGMELGNAVLTALADRGAGEIKGYVACDNRAMNRMVQRMGFERLAEIALHDGRPSILYVIRCRS
jgi:glycosyltransferase involved in cell wall biosynthesis/ribosomal protein S18 acetylase RimI-like enzyme